MRIVMDNGFEVVVPSGCEKDVLDWLLRDGQAKEGNGNVIKRVGRASGYRVRHWTSGEDQKLNEMRKAGYDFVEIGRAIGRTNNAVRVRVYSKAFRQAYGD